MDGLTVEEIDPITREQYVVTVDPLEHLAEGASVGRVVLTAEAEDESGHVTVAERTVEIASRRQWTFPTLGRVWQAPELLWDGAVAVVTADGVLHVVEADGTERCHARADGERGTSSPTYAPTANALVWGTTHHVRVTDAETCAEIYEDALLREFVSKPVVTEDGMAHATTFDGTLVSFRVDGTERRVIALNELVAGGSAMEMRSNIVEGPMGDLYVAAKVGSTGGALFAVRAGSDEVEVAELTSPVNGDALVTDTAIFFGGADGSVYGYELDLTRRWVASASDGLTVLTRPAFDGDVVIVGDGEGRVHGRDPDTGEIQWEYDAVLDRSPTGVGLIGRAGMASGPAGDIAFGDTLGLLHVLGPGGFLRFRAPVAGGGTGDGIVARPAVSSSQVFIGAENQTLTAFALR
ncbi:MAG: PQQ-binding-like beta-propeller repeat protein [Deltaproteobacteria bacterium]|nr:PQQ-binding-like beta-propeller repeat protein [Deltaproteobacteria bacterium]